jgi:hypothetical protein
VKARNVAWALWVVTLALDLGAYAVYFAGRAGTPLYGYWVEGTFISPVFATLGALIVSRRPENGIGWIFLIAGVLGGVQMFSGQYATVALAHDGSVLSGGAVLGWLSTRAQFCVVFLVLFLIFLFPNGRLLSPRWRPVAWSCGTFLVLSMLADAVSPGPLEDFPSGKNPFGIEALGPLPDFLEAVGPWLGVCCVAAAILSLLLRYYRSRGEERLQLKWFAYGATLGFLTIVFAGEVPLVGTFSWTLGFLALPVSAGVAILRYRLYDIDRIINRTLVYGLLTAALVLVYVGSVFSLQYAFRALTGETSQIVIVASTLAIAALFNPLRSHIQDVVDRRFYRKRYDAARTLEAFSKRLRDETDLSILSGDLVGVVGETVAPAHVSLWLCNAGTRKTS